MEPPSPYDYKVWIGQNFVEIGAQDICKVFINFIIVIFTKKPTGGYVRTYFTSIHIETVFQLAK